jgi:hypothetical protein
MEGDSIQSALEAVVRASFEVIVSDLEEGLDPLGRRAPDDEWRGWHDTMRTGKMGGLFDMPLECVLSVAVLADITVVRHQPSKQPERTMHRWVPQRHEQHVA